MGAFCALRSQHWCQITALKGLMARRVALDPKDYPDQDARARLMDDLKRRWTYPPICASVAIKVWQKYFDISCSSPGGVACDEAVQQILKWIPLRADQCMPSNLVKVLSTHGWLLRIGIDP